MSDASLVSNLPEPTVPIGPSHRISEDPKTKWEIWWNWFSEQANPIVIKEIRQSLKSRQFTISFGLTLIAAVGWTVVAVSLMVPRIYYLPAGLPLLTGFFCILTLPLMVIIPFSAFRSLTSETEDGTFELLSISALSSTQIIYGKMASACVQIILYLSALAPCIVLTYLLRGVGLFSILFLLGLTVLFSFAETAAALTLASVSRSRMVQNGFSVLVLAGLLLGFFSWATTLIAALGSGADELSNPPKEVFLVLFGALTVVILLISLLLRTAAAAIDFPSENNSTPLRLRILAVVSLLVFWFTMACVASEELAPILPISVILFAVFMFIGGLVCGERGVISPRTQRRLPKTFFGRVFLSFLYPGAGLGYVFLICVFFGWSITFSLFEVFYSDSLRNSFGDLSVTLGCYTLSCYLALYIGVNRLIMLAIPTQVQGRMVVSICMLAVTVLLVHLLPMLAVYYMNDYRDPVYGVSQTFNIFWTMERIMDNGSADVMAGPIVLLTLCAIAIFGLNLAMCTKDIMLIRVAEPPRVIEDETKDQTLKPEPIDPFV